jgi:hypothetical protein
MQGRIKMSNTLIKVIDLVPGEVRELSSLESKALVGDTFWADYVRKQTPILIRNAAQDWQALDRWGQPGYLESLCGEERANMLRMFNPSVYFRPMFDSGKLSEHIAEMRALPDDQTCSIPATEVPKKWAQDLGTYTFLSNRFDKRPRAFSKRRLFIYKNASTEWHYHITDETLTTQLVGSKRFSLFHLNDETWNVYSQVLKHNCHHLACAKQFFVRQPTIVKYEGYLTPGDALYIPPFWWHGIDPIDAGVGITLAHCFRTPLSRVGKWSQEPAVRDVVRSMSGAAKTKALGLICLGAVARLVAREN